MKALMVLFVMVATAACASEPKEPAVAGFAWRGFAQAIAEAPASKKMILVDVYTDW